MDGVIAFVRNRDDVKGGKGKVGYEKCCHFCLRHYKIKIHAGNTHYTDVRKSKVYLKYHILAKL